YHLGYGGIEQAVSSLVEILKNDYEISILSFYRLYDQPVFYIDPSVHIKYLYETDVPLKVKKYNQLLKKKQIGKLIGVLWNDYFKGFHLIHFFHDFYYSMQIYFLGGRFRRLKKHLKNSEAEIHISTRYEISGYLSKYGRKESLKVGWEHNHHHGNEKYKNSVALGNANLDYLVLVSRMLTKDYQKELALKRCRPVYIPNMITHDLDFVSDYKEPRILMVGRLEAEKGLFDALEVAKRMQERQIAFHLDIVGDGPLRADLEKNIFERNLENYVTIHGFQNHEYIGQLYRHASLNLMTSFTESFGLVLLEAMNAGIPCVAFSSAEGACELIQNDYNGYLIMERNVDEMVNQVVLLLENREKLAILGENAKLYSKNFLPHSIKAMWMQMLNGGK
ncbi:MAG: glycosyltransferase family 4 protein, partial [Bacilli bacterium]|nr:glycosyltransferase family 4 protein [Bacilli bacterium]